MTALTDISRIVTHVGWLASQTNGEKLGIRILYFIFETSPNDITVAVENSSNELVQGLHLMYNHIHGSSKDGSKTSMKISTNAGPSDIIPQY